jgi:aryl-alcohol dehydrogenase
VPRNYAGVRLDGTSPISRHGAPVTAVFFGQSSFASHAIADRRNVVKVDAGDDLAIMGPLGCGLQTGAGAILRSLDCPAGSTLAVFGGRVGLAAVMAARHRGCSRIVLVEPVAARRELGLGLGATDAIDPADGDVAAAIRALLPDGVDFALESSGRVGVMETALASLASRGALGLVGVPPRADDALSINIAGMITFGHRIMGIIEGDSDLQGFIPNSSRSIAPGIFRSTGWSRPYPGQTSTRQWRRSIAANA